MGGLLLSPKTFEWSDVVATKALTHLVCPHHRSLLPSSVLNMLVSVTTRHTPVGASINHSSNARECCSSPSKYCLCRTAKPFSWCPHGLFRFESHESLACDIRHTPTFLCTSQLLVSPGGCQLEPCSLECKHKFALVTTQALSAAMEKEGDSRSLSYQWVYMLLETHSCC